VTRIYILLGCLALVFGAAWFIDHRAFARGQADGLERANRAAAALDAALDINTQGAEVVDRLRAALAQCHEQNKVDVRTALEVSDAAQAEADRIAAQLAEQNAKRLAMQAGECRSWAEQAACGSVQ
jgi:hypothetical protein